MSAELTALALAALLQFVQIGLAGRAMNRDVGVTWNASPRDVDASSDFSPLTGRLRRAVDNHFEALALFTIAVLVVTLSGAGSWLTAACAWTYLVARILYVPAYARGWVPWRSILFAIGAIATITMILAALLT